METIGERIKKLREKKNMNQTELSEVVKAKTYTTVSKWESNDNFPKGKDIKILAEFFDVTSDYLLGLNDESSLTTITTIYNELTPPRQNKVYNYAERQLEEQRNTKIVSIVGQTAAGEAIAYGDSIVEEREVSYVPKGAECALAVKGHSMEPDFKNGSVVFYKKQSQVEYGEIAVVEIEGNGVTLKKVKYDYDNEKIILQSLNKEYEDMIFDNHQIRILGKVVK